VRRPQLTLDCVSKSAQIAALTLDAMLPAMHRCYNELWLMSVVLIIRPNGLFVAMHCSLSFSWFLCIWLTVGQNQIRQQMNRNCACNLQNRVLRISHILDCVFLHFPCLPSFSLFLRAKAATAFSAFQPSQFGPSVRLSIVWISQKRRKLGSPNLHRRLLGRL